MLPGIDTRHGARRRTGAVTGNDEAAADSGIVIEKHGCPRIVAFHGDNPGAYPRNPRGTPECPVKGLPENAVLHDPAHGMVADIPMIVVKEEGRLAIRDADIEDCLGVGDDVLPCVKAFKNELRTPGNGGDASVE